MCGSGQRLQYFHQFFKGHPARCLQQHQCVLEGLLRECRFRCLGGFVNISFGMSPMFVECFAYEQCPAGMHRKGCFHDLTMFVVCLFAHLKHIAQHNGLLVCFQCAEILKCGSHAAGIGVVIIADECVVFSLGEL